MSFISYCGIIKGSFALCLVFKIPDFEDTTSSLYVNERGVIVTSTVSAIIFSILIFGALLPLAQQKLAPATPETQLEYYDFEDNDKNQEEHFGENARLTVRPRLDGSMVNTTHDESLQPSNETSRSYSAGVIKNSPFFQKGKDCTYFLIKLDQEILKPLMIYKYDKEEMD